MFGILEIILPILAVLALGFLSRKKALLSSEGIEGLKGIVMNFALPCLLVGAFYTADYGAANVIVALVMFACCFAGLFLGRLIKKAFRMNQDFLPFLTTGFEAGMMGYGLYLMLFPGESLANFAMVDLGQVLFVFTFYMAVLNTKKGVGTRSTLLSMLKSPIFLAVCAGVFLGATGLGKWIDASPAGETVAAVLDYIGAPTGILMIFVVGYGLRFELSGLKDALAAATARIAVMALLCLCALFLISSLVPMTYGLYWAVVLMFILPAPFVLPVFAGSQKDTAYISTSLSVYTLISILLFAVIAATAAA
ncbi:AEC family transporter [Christensenella intestinihominis]|uniref:AEC family transporter n=1 Tax=Christensenella intestinihominis TaxID=1851429 RepID=UPI00082CEF3C|nr:AEC family transporter [Christensenella intestinihominis]